MLFQYRSVEEKRTLFREAIDSGKLLRFPGAFSPYITLMIEQLNFEGVYISGATLSNDLGYPDIGLTTMTEVTQRGRAIARATKLPTIIDADTGFGEAVNVARTVQEFEDLGLCGCHFEDQVLPKRCGHLANKTLVSKREMCEKLQSAVQARRDTKFLIIARTDARQGEGLDAAILRAQSYIEAGADMIFPEALNSAEEFAYFRKKLKIPLLANMTEFGKSPLLSYTELEELGYNIVIYPVSTFRLAMGAVEKGLQSIMEEGSQASVVDKMQTRKELYHYLQYDAYEQLDKKVGEFRSPENDST